MRLSIKKSHIAYQLALPPNLRHIHDVFYISQLWKHIHDLSHIINKYQPLKIKLEGLHYKDVPMQIVDYQFNELSNKEVLQVKVVLDPSLNTKVAWEIFFRQRRCNTPDLSLTSYKIFRDDLVNLH